VLDPQGRVISAYDNPRPPSRAQPSLVTTYVPITVAGRRVGDYVLVREQEMAGQFLIRCLAVAAALFFAAAGLSLFLGRWLAKRVVEPIERLAEGMREVAQNSDFARRVEPMADDELGRLTGCFNGLIERLQVNDGELRETLNALTHARDAAEAANVQKSQFLANMSHEIRTPLNGVLAMAQIMALGDMTDEQRERLTVIRKSGEALLEILNDILDVSKIEAGKLELDPIEFDVEGVIHGARDGFAAVAQRKGLALSVEIDADARGARLGDPARLRQIVSNLVSNALKFTSAGTVAVTAAPMVCGSACATAASACPPKRFRCCSRNSPSSTPRPRVSSAAPASGSPSAMSWWC
jgi:signal transduction histidine kinase